MSNIFDARDIAKWLLTWASADEELPDISNLKLQKLLYFAQGYSLAILDKPLFSNEIQAWAHGPVVPDVYQEYKTFEGRPINTDVFVDFSTFPDEVNTLLASVWTTFGGFSAWKLREITHKEGPWKDCYNSAELGTVITEPSLEKYFKSLYSSSV